MCPMNEDVGFRLLRGPVQQLWDVATVDDDLNVRADILLKFGDLLGPHANDRLLPLRVDEVTARAEDFDAARDVDNF